jgi:hypothetical protein
LPSLSMVYGSPGCFKTMLMIDMGLCVAAGEPWLPSLPGKGENTQRATLRSPVLWCDFDNGPRTMDERTEAVGRGRNLPEDTPFYYVSMPSPWLDGGNFGSVSDLIRLVKILEVRLVIIDNLCDVSGGAEENSAEMGTILSNFRRLAEDAEAAVVLIHHPPKIGNTPRGHSSILAALDLALLIERERHADTIKAVAPKVRGTDVLPFGAIFTYEHKLGTTELAIVKFFGTPMEDQVSDRAVREMILEIVQAYPDLNKTKLVERVRENLPDVSFDRIRTQIDFLTTEGKLTTSPGGRNAIFYSLPIKK